MTFFRLAKQIFLTSFVKIIPKLIERFVRILFYIIYNYLSSDLLYSIKYLVIFINSIERFERLMYNNYLFCKNNLLDFVGEP